MEDEEGEEAKKTGGRLYVSQIENSLTKALSVSYMKKLHSSIITPITIPVRDHSSGLPPTTVGPAFSVPTPGDNILSYLFVVNSCHLLFSLNSSLFLLLLQPLPLVLKFFLSIFIFVLIFLLLLLLSSFFSFSFSFPTSLSFNVWRRKYTL